MLLENKRKIKILHILLGNEFGGATVSVRLLCQYQAAKGYDVSVLINNIPRSRDEFIKHNIKLVDDKGIRGHISPYDLFHLFYLFWFIKKNGFDIVHTQAVKAGIIGRLAAKLAGIKPVIHSGHGYGFEEKFKNNSILKTVYLRIERLLTKITTMIITPSRGDYNTALEDIAPKEKLRIVYNGIETSDYRKEVKSIYRNQFRNEIGVGDDEIVVGVVARLHKAKGHKYLIDAAAQILKSGMGKVKFVFIGDGPEEDNLKEKVNKCRLEKHFKFLNHRDDIPCVMQGLDIHVLPSLREGFGLSLLEAMAAGKACVATDVGGPTEVVEDGVTGFIVPPKDPKRLAEAIKKLVKDKALLNKMGEKGASRVHSKFTSKIMGNNISDIYNSYIK